MTDISGLMPDRTMMPSQAVVRMALTSAGWKPERLTVKRVQGRYWHKPQTPMMATLEEVFS